MGEQNTFACLYVKAKETVLDNPGVQQVIALQTACGNMHVILNDRIISGNHDAEDRLLTKLTQNGDTHVTHIVALWSDCQPDLPSYHFRSRLVALNARNLDALLFMGNAEITRTRTLRSTM